MLRRETLVCDTIEDGTGIANLIVWAASLERFRHAALGAHSVALHRQITARGDRAKLGFRARLRSTKAIGLPMSSPKYGAHLADNF
jgi:hypothetical protein